MSSGTTLGVGRDAARVVVGSAGDQSGPKFLQDRIRLLLTKGTFSSSYPVLLQLRLSCDRIGYDNSLRSRL